MMTTVTTRSSATEEIPRDALCW